MKKILLLPLLLLVAAVFGQPKPKQKEKMPSQKEMQEMMKEMQAAIDELSPEEKRMMDSMGIKLPSAKMIPKVSDKQMADAWENENRVVPKKDANRIAAIPKKVNDGNMKGYLAAVQKKTAELFPANTRAAAEKVYNYIKANSNNNGETGNMAFALWIDGRQQLALLVMGKLIAEDPRNTDHLSNYASMLSMMGAQHLAIPILSNLNARFPNNSTLLNNLGQAWFGLGEIEKAEKYLDSAIRIYAYHPQANLTKAAIEESKGDHKKTVEAVKRSIKHSYSTEKEEKLRQLGHTLKRRDLYLPFKPGPDPLGLEKVKRPDYPTSLHELKQLKAVWQQFDNECNEAIARLQNQKKELTGQLTRSLSGSMMQGLPIHAKKASLQLAELNAYHENKIMQIATKFAELRTDLETIKAQKTRVAPEAPCEEHQRAEDDFIKKYNERKRAYDDEFLQVHRHFLNDMAYWSQYTAVSKEQFELMVADFKITWLNKLKEYRPLLSSPREFSECVSGKEIKKGGKLAEFDDVACNYNDTMDLKVIVFINNCSKMTSKLNLKFAEYTRIDNFNRAEGDTYEASTIKISAEQGFDGLKLDKGPLKLEAKVGAGIELEMDRGGVKDVTLITEAKAGAGVNVFDEGLEESGSIAGKDAIDTTVEIGVEGRISLVSGKGKLGGTGLLENVKLAGW